MIFHGNGEERLRAIAGPLIESPSTRKIESLLGVSISDVERNVTVVGVSNNIGMDRSAISVVKTKGGECDLHTGCPAHGNTERVVAQDLELERPLLGHTIERSP